MVQQDEKPMALTGLKVLDLSRILAGPYATQLFADLGADVVKVENPDGGDDTRRWGPPFTRRQMAVAEMPLIFLHATAIKDRSLLILPVKLGRICCAILPPKLILLWKISVPED